MKKKDKQKIKYRQFLNKKKVNNKTSTKSKLRYYRKIFKKLSLNNDQHFTKDEIKQLPYIREMRKRVYPPLSKEVPFEHELVDVSSLNGTISKFKVFYRILQIVKTTKIVEGGKQFTFRALAVAGDYSTQVGFGIGKGDTSKLAESRAIRHACQRMFQIPNFSTNYINKTIPKEICARHKRTWVILKPKYNSTGIKANSAIYFILKLGGIVSCTAKKIGPNNLLNTIYATLKALKNLSEENSVLSEFNDYGFEKRVITFERFPKKSNNMKQNENYPLIASWNKYTKKQYIREFFKFKNFNLKPFNVYRKNCNISKYL